MGSIINRNISSGELILCLAALVVLAGIQCGFAEDQEITQLRKAAEQGDVTAQYNLGTRYFTSMGVTQDDVEAAKWFRKAAEQGNARAQVALGSMYVEDDGLGGVYVESDGVAQDFVEAAKWFRKAAEQGNTRAQVNLGGMYSGGMGVTQDDVQAYAWVNLAADQGDGLAVDAKNIVKSEMTAEQVAEAEKLSAELFNRIEAAKSE